MTLGAMKGASKLNVLLFIIIKYSQTFLRHCDIRLGGRPREAQRRRAYFQRYTDGQKRKKVERDDQHLLFRN